MECTSSANIVLVYALYRTQLHILSKSKFAENLRNLEYFESCRNKLRCIPFSVGCAIVASCSSRSHHPAVNVARVARAHFRPFPLPLSALALYFVTRARSSHAIHPSDALSWAPTHSNCTLRVDCSCSRRRLLLTAPQSPPLPYLTKKRRNTLDNTVYFVNYVACIRNHDYFFKVMFNALTSHTHTQTAIWRWCTRIDGGGVLLVCIPCFCSFVCTLHIERILFIGAKASNYQLIQWIYFCCCCFVRVVYRFFNNASGSIALSMIHFDTMTTTTESIWRRDCNRHNGQTLKKKLFHSSIIL